MKITGLVVFLLSVLTATAQTNDSGRPDCRNPVRLLGKRGAVDLTPLFEWWTAQKSAMTNESTAEGGGTNAFSAAGRPLAAWFLITGRKVAVVGDSWLVDAAIYSSPAVSTNARIVLRNPPVQEEERFNSLQSRLEELEQFIANIRSRYYADSNAVIQAQSMMDQDRRGWGKRVTADYAVNYRIKAKKQDAAATDLRQLTQWQSSYDQLEIQLQAIPSDHEVYQVAWFAILRGRNQQGLMIFDVGQLPSVRSP